MNIFDLSKKILLKIVSNEIPFAVALKSVFKNENIDAQNKGNVTALVGCELRHHLMFDNIVSQFIDGVEFEKTIFLRFYLSNHLFLKRFLDKEILSLAQKDIGKEKIEEIINFISTTNDLISENLDRSSPQFLSCRFNTPAWVVNMWQKQFSKGLTFKILKANYHQSTPTLRVDTNKINVDEFLKSHPEFKLNICDEIIEYIGKGMPKHVDEFASNQIFFMKPATKKLLDKLPVEPFKKMVIFSDIPNNIYLDLNVRTKENLNMDLIINHTQSYYDTKKMIDKLHLNGISLYNTESKNISTCVSSKVDLFLCLPTSTAFDLLRSTPDYFLRVKQEKLDAILNEQKIALEESSLQVSEGGLLVYLVPTLNKKESTIMIGQFLAEHNDFELIEEKQHFPFEDLDSCLYYAIMRKK